MIDTRLEHVFGIGQWPSLRHEVLLSVALDAFLDGREVSVIRGYQTDRYLRPDAEIWMDVEYDSGIRNERFFVEYDTGEETHHQVEKKWAAYAERSTEKILVITNSQRRRDEILRRCDLVSDRLLACVHDELVSTPDGNVWIDFSGEATTL